MPQRVSEYIYTMNVESLELEVNVQILSGVNTIPERRYGIYNVNEDAGFIGYI